MSEMNSFYGGNQGASFVIAKIFDGIDIPQITGQYIYKRNAYATDVNNIFIITDSGQEEIFLLMKKMIFI